MNERVKAKMKNQERMELKGPHKIVSNRNNTIYYAVVTLTVNFLTPDRPLGCKIQSFYTFVGVQL